MSFKYKGYVGKILRINLSERKVNEEKLKEEWLPLFLGARGLGAKILFEEVDPSSADPLGPENKLIFATGPLNGTRAPSSSRYALVTKSPLTGLFLESLAAGFLAPELKFAGYDALVIEGISKNPVYLWITNEGCEIKDADWLWGMPTEETQKYLKEETDEKAKIACIGPAGENLVKFACVMSEFRAFGRGGAGAVMGSKKLKAIAVLGDEKELEIADHQLFDSIVRDIYTNCRKNTLTSETYPKYGTTYLVDVINDLGIFPTKNFQEAVFEGAEKLSAGVIRKKVVVKDKSCYRCPVACTKISVIRSGFYVGVVAKNPEYETIWAFGPQCGNDCLEAVVAANKLCDQFGLDTISTGNIIGFAMECFEKGLITKDDTGGLELKFGNHEVFLEIIRRIAYRQGIGNLLAEGVKQTSQKIGKGSEKFAMHVKGLELPAYDPRGAWGMGLAYATSNRGGCHLKAWTISAEAISGTLERFSIEGKAKFVKNDQDTRTAIACTGLCLFASKAVPLNVLANLIKAVTGMQITQANLLQIGERVYNLERAYNVLAGASRKDDILPKRVFEDPIPKGPTKGKFIKLEDFNEMLNQYYRIRGWDNNGVPTKEKLSELGLNDVTLKIKKALK